MFVIHLQVIDSQLNASEQPLLLVLREPMCHQLLPFGTGFGFFPQQVMAIAKMGPEVTLLHC